MPSSKHYSQLKGYFDLAFAVIGVLTNGVEYRFYTATKTDGQDGMDKFPFFQFDVTDINVENEILEILPHFCDSHLDKRGFEEAKRLKHRAVLEAKIDEELKCPPNKLVDHFIKEAFGGNISKKERKEMMPIVKNAIEQILLNKTDDAYRQESHIVAVVSDDNKTIREKVKEWEIYVRGILRHSCISDNIIHQESRKGNSHVLCFNSKTNPLVRLSINGEKLTMEFYDENGKKNKHAIPYNGVDTNIL